MDSMIANLSLLNGCPVYPFQEKGDTVKFHDFVLS